MDKNFEIVKTWKPDEIAPLYCHYSGQTNPQDAYLEIDCERKKICFTYNGEIGNAVPFSVYNGRDRRIGCSKYMSVSQIEQIINDDEFISLVNRILAGYESKYNSQSNLIGYLNEDACSAEKELEKYFEDYNEGGDEVWDIGDWLTSSIMYYDNNGNKCSSYDAVSVQIDGIEGSITANSTDEELDILEDKIKTDAFSQHVYLDGDINEFLKYKRNICKENLDQ